MKSLIVMSTTLLLVCNAVAAPPAWWRNQSPRVQITSFTNGQEIEMLYHWSLLLEAEASDPDGKVVRVDYYDGTNYVGSSVPGQPPSWPTGSPVWALPNYGVYWLPWPGETVLTAVATDDRGATTGSDAVAVRVSGPPVVNVHATDALASEAGDPGQFTISRTGASDAALPVFYFVGGSASNGEDYLPLTNSLVIPAGEEYAEIDIKPLQDLLPDGRETVSLFLTDAPLLPNSLPAPPVYWAGPSSTAVLFITDDDGGPTNHAPAVRLGSVLSATPPDSMIGRSPLYLSVTAYDSDGSVVLVEYFADGRRIGVVSNTAPWDSRPRTAADVGVLFAGQMPALTDSGFSWPEGIDMGASQYEPAMVIAYGDFGFSWNARPGQYVLTAKATDNDGASTLSLPVIATVTAIPVVRIRANDAFASEPGAGRSANPGTFTIKRTGNTDRPLPVYYHVRGTAICGTDYALAPDEIWGSLDESSDSIIRVVTIPAGQAGAELTVIPLGDEFAEKLETVTVTLTIPIPLVQPAWMLWPIDWPPYTFGKHARATVVIGDNVKRSTLRPWGFPIPGTPRL